MLPPGGDVWQAQHVAVPGTFSKAVELIQPGQDAGDQRAKLPAYNRKVLLQRLGEARGTVLGVQKGVGVVGSRKDLWGGGGGGLWV